MIIALSAVLTITTPTLIFGESKNDQKPAYPVAGERQTKFNQRAEYEHRLKQFSKQISSVSGIIGSYAIPKEQESAAKIIKEANAGLEELKKWYDSLPAR